MRPHPTHPKHLPGSKWTAMDQDLPFRHWEVRRVNGDEVELFAALNKAEVLRLPWRELRERSLWVPDWK